MGPCVFLLGYYMKSYSSCYHALIFISTISPRPPPTLSLPGPSVIHYYTEDKRKWDDDVSFIQFHNLTSSDGHGHDGNLFPILLVNHSFLLTCKVTNVGSTYVPIAFRCSPHNENYLYNVIRFYFLLCFVKIPHWIQWISSGKQFRDMHMFQIFHPAAFQLGSPHLILRADSSPHVLRLWLVC